MNLFKKLIVGFFVTTSIVATPTKTLADAVIFSGSDVKALKSNLDLNGNSKVMSGSVDPTSSATSAPIGSLYLNTSNGNLYKKTDSGSSTNWVQMSGGGDAGINYLAPNSGAEAGTTGWSTYADAAGVSPVDGTGGSPNTTWTRSTSSPLRGVGSFLFTKSSGASRQGEGASYSFSINNADQGKPLSVSFDYILVSGTFTASDGITAPANSGTTVTAGNSTVSVHVYDVTNAALIPVTPSVITCSSTTVNCSFKGSFQTASNSTSYRFILHTSYVTDAAMVMKFDNFYVGPQAVNYGYAGGDWFSWGSASSFVGFGTPTNISLWAKRDGDGFRIRGHFTAGTTTAVRGTIALPPGCASLDTTKFSTVANMTKGFGRFVQLSNGGSTGFYTGEGNLIYNGTATLLEFQKSKDSTSYTYNTSTASGLFTSGDVFDIQDTFIPCTGLSSNVVVSNDTDTRVISMFAYKNGGAISANTDVASWTTVTDRAGAFNATSGVYTVPVSGDYQVSYYNSANAATAVSANIMKNGSAVIGGMAMPSTIAESGASGVLTGLKAGDTISVQSGYAFTASSTTYKNTLSIHRLSGPSAIAASEKVYLLYTGNAGTALTGGTTKIDWSTKVVDSHGAWGVSNTTFTAPRAGWCNWTGGVYVTVAADYTVDVYINGVQKYAMQKGGSAASQSIAGGAYLNAGDLVTFISDTSRTLSNSARFHWLAISCM